MLDPAGNDPGRVGDNQMPVDVFAQALAFTLQAERGLSMDPNDPGNWTGGRIGAGMLQGTNYGLSSAAYPELDIQALDLETAARIYRRDYWQRPGFHLVAELAPEVAVRLFDLGVNCGAGTAARMLQRGLNTVCCVDMPARRLNPWRQQVARLIGGKTLLVDGKIGRVTLEVLKVCPYKGAVLAALKGEAYCHYAKLDPGYRAGWLKRLEA